MIAPKEEKAAAQSKEQKLEEILAILGDLYERVLARPEQQVPITPVREYGTVPQAGFQVPWAAR